MDTEDILRPSRKDTFLHITVTEIICVFLLIAVVLVIKYFFKAEFSEFKEWYNQKIAVDIDINQVLEDEGNEI